MELVIGPENIFWCWFILLYLSFQLSCFLVKSRDGLRVTWVTGGLKTTLPRSWPMVEAATECRSIRYLDAAVGVCAVSMDDEA